MKKKYGQNFLINQLIVNQIIEAANIEQNDEILEVGPGDGILTKEIIKKKPEKLITLEIDTSLIEKLKRLFNKNTNKKYELIFTDALKFKENSKFKTHFKIISNLPYNISIPLLIKWTNMLKKNPIPTKMVLMFQKEVAERICANVNSKKYGRISVLISTFYNIKKIIDVDKKDFFPIPKINSTVLLLDVKKNPKININDIKYLEKITTLLFNNKRKKLKKKIQSIFSKEIIEHNSLNTLYDLRVENLSIDLFCTLASLLKN